MSKSGHEQYDYNDYEKPLFYTFLATTFRVRNLTSMFARDIKRMLA
jgi:hypothetical protein